MDTIKTEHTPDGRRWADLDAAQLVAALGPTRPKTMAAVNALAREWAQARGFAGVVSWTIDDLVDAGLAERRAGRPRAFRWVRP